MAKISELAKTYRLLSDPNAPDWNVKFVGALVLALGLVAGAGAVVWHATQGGDASAAPGLGAEARNGGGPGHACDPAEVAQVTASEGVATLPPGYELPSGCITA